MLPSCKPKAVHVAPRIALPKWKSEDIHLPLYTHTHTHTRHPRGCTLHLEGNPSASAWLTWPSDPDCQPSLWRHLLTPSLAPALRYPLLPPLPWEVGSVLPGNFYSLLFCLEHCLSQTSDHVSRPFPYPYPASLLFGTLCRENLVLRCIAHLLHRNEDGAVRAGAPSCMDLSLPVWHSRGGAQPRHAG